MQRRWSVCRWWLGAMTWLFLPAGLAPADDPAAPNAGASVAEGPFRLVSAARQEQLRRCLPRLADRRMQAVLDDPTLLLYTEQEMPQAYQDFSGDLQGIHSPAYNISANRSEPFGNGNREFPWNAPAGTHRSPGVESFRFLWLPKQPEGHPWPVVWYRKRLPGDRSPGYAWLYPVGTIVGEVLTLAAPDGYDYTFELRVRIRESDDWAVDVFRPFLTSDELAQRITELRPNWQENPQLARLVWHLVEPRDLEPRHLVDRQPGRRVFEQTMGVDTLPDAGDDALIAELLTESVFRSALGARWREGANGVPTCAPTTEAPFHIVPARYDAGFIDVDRHSCTRCHETVKRHVREFNAGRDWYGRIRGSDGIFSFHPFDPGSISGNGYGVGVRMRTALIEAGIVAAYDKQAHPDDRYRVLPFLVE